MRSRTLRRFRLVPRLRSFITQGFLIGSSLLAYVYTLLTHAPLVGILRSMKATVKKWGNSAAVRIPTSVMQAAQLDLDQAVEVREEGGRIVIEPSRQKKYQLSELVKGITPQNRHEETDWGAPVGKEVW